MGFCEPGVKATVNYQFKETKKRYITNNTPIDVHTYSETIGRTSNYNPEGYGITFYSPNNRLWYTYPIKDYTIYYEAPYTNEGGYYIAGYYGISFVHCGGTDFDRNPDGSLNGPEVDPNTITTDPNLKCPIADTSDAKTKCFIEVKHDGNTVFKDSGDCPVSFKVACGEECPEGTVKCFSTNYPGYCCLPCSEIKAEIKAIVSQVRSINNG